MKTFKDLIADAHATIDEAEQRGARNLAKVRSIYAEVGQANRTQLTADETAEVSSAMEAQTRAQTDAQAARENLANLTRAQAQEDQATNHLADRGANPTGQAALPAYDQVARVGHEERTYHKGNAPTGGAFVRDVAMSFLFRDAGADARLAQHMREEQVERGQYLKRAVGTGAFTGLVVPQYLTDMFAPAIAARRPFADACNRHPLPAEGMTVSIGRLTTATGAGLQATENSAVSETNADDTLLTIPVQTAAGSQTVSRQAIERGTGIEDTLVSDLNRRLATVLDGTLLNQASTGLAAVSASVAYVDATPTGPEMYPKFLGAAAGSEAALLGLANPDMAVMHSRRWYWLQSQMTSTWPMFGQQGIPAQLVGVNLAEVYGRGMRGVLPNGMVVIVDNNVVTTAGGGTEDEVYVVPSEECHLWEDPNAPQFIRAEQTNAKTLGVDIVLYEYFAYTFARFTNSHQKIAGTGLIAPTF